ncbi:MAG: hypothetical protein U0271_41795 [Polyangiaceae bacterium]
MRATRGLVTAILGCAWLGLAGLACGDDNEGPGGAGGVGGGTGGGAAGGTVGGAGGSGGGAPVCPEGSHEGPNGCEATLGAYQETSALNAARDHHMTFSLERPNGTFLYVAGGYKNQATPVTSFERALVNADGTLAPWEVLPNVKDVSGAGVVTLGDKAVIMGGYRGFIHATRTVDIYTADDDGNLTESAGPDLIDPRFHVGAVLTNGFIYVVGGMNSGGTSLTTVERASFDGTTVGAFQADTALPLPCSHQGVATDGKSIFVTGGLARVNGDFANDVPYDSVLSAPIQADGTLGAWTDLGTMPVSLSIHASFVHAGSLYVVGGLKDVTTFVKTVYRAPIAEDGTLGAWETLAIELPRTRGHSHQDPMIGPFTYSVGGYAGTSQTQVYFARFE